MISHLLSSANTPMRKSTFFNWMSSFLILDCISLHLLTFSYSVVPEPDVALASEYIKLGAWAVRCRNSDSWSQRGGLRCCFPKPQSLFWHAQLENHWGNLMYCLLTGSLPACGQVKPVVRALPKQLEQQNVLFGKNLIFGISVELRLSSYKNYLGIYLGKSALTSLYFRS